MSTVARQKLEQQLDKGQVNPTYLLLGEEDYLRKLALQRIRDVALAGSLLRELNEMTFALSSAPIAEAISASMQLPMMSDRRAVVITELEKLSEKDEQLLLRYLQDPADTTVLILIARDLDGRRKSTKAIMQACTTIVFEPLKKGELIAWTRAQLRQLKRAADETTIRLLVDHVGNNLRMLSNELEKLAIASSGTGRITTEMVESLIGESRELSNFELADSLVARNRKAALRTLQRLLDGGAEPVMLVGIIAGNYRKLALAKQLWETGSDPNQVMRSVGVPDWKRNEFLATLNRVSSAELAERLRRIAMTDLAIKTSKGTPRLQLEMLVYELAA